jgi:hypothetical protein
VALTLIAPLENRFLEVSSFLRDCAALFGYGHERRVDDLAARRQ